MLCAAGWGTNSFDSCCLSMASVVHPVHAALSSHRPEKVVEEILAAAGRQTVASTGNVFHDLMSCVIEQQIHYRSTKKTFEKLLSFTSITELDLGNYHEFEKLALPRVRLSENKYNTIAAVLDFWKKNDVNWHELTDDEVRERLCTIKGVGHWTVDMILLYTLQRPDVFPADDHHLKQIMSSIYGFDPEKGLRANMLDAAESWRPHRSQTVLALLWAKRNSMV